ncbi:MAG TPA: dihydrodipicolinate synthase family protein [Bryobacteraceae bacterium]|nr:dihydrodipicolinate synthase family protein [Bryobacteraceae bacterium]
MLTAFRGLVPAIPIPLREDLRLDEPALRAFVRWLSARPGIGGLVTNGHTGEVFALSREQRAEVTRIVADELAGRVPVISGICCEGIDEAVDHARLAKDAGASGLLVMPPHYWLRFGMQASHVVDHFAAIGKAVRLPLVVHIYPAWTKASYSSELLAQLAQIEEVTTFKIGTREMSKYDRDIRAVRASNPRCTILTCHDEYLLPTLVQGVDGALVGFGSFLPEWIAGLYDTVFRGDLKEAQAIQEKIYRLKQVVYASDEPSGEAHARLKTAMMLAGRFPSNRMLPPVDPPSGATLERIRAAVEEAALTPIPEFAGALV